MGFHIGTSGWAYASWKPGFYPSKLPARKFLEYYATQLNSVEVNYTFRQLPSETMLEGWLAAAGEDFTFSFKAPQRITHFSRLKDCAGPLAALYSALAPVARAGRLGVVLFQLPPNFIADTSLLDDFLSTAQSEAVLAQSEGVRLAFEFRHRSWFRDETFRVLERHRAALCVAESDELESPDVTTAPFRCYRLRKGEYLPENLEKVIENIQIWTKKGPVFAYFKHEEEPSGALSAATVLRRLRQA